MSERDIQKAVFAEFRKRRMPHAMMWAVPNGPDSRRVPGFCAGASDVMAVNNGEFFALELKTEDGKPSCQQMEFVKNIQAARCTATFAYGLDDALATLKAWGLIR